MIEWKENFHTKYHPPPKEFIKKEIKKCPKI